MYKRQYHRCVDALYQIPDADTDHIAISGHSRGGKTVLLAGATDKRVKYVNPNCSGTHGCGCYRYISHDDLGNGDKRSEPLCYLFGIVPYWLGPKLKNYVEMCIRDRCMHISVWIYCSQRS